VIATTDVIQKEGWLPVVTGAKRVAYISAFGHDVMNLFLVSLRNGWLFSDIPRTTTNIDKPVAKNTKSDILRQSRDAFSLGSTAKVVVMRRNNTMVHVDLDDVLSLAMFVCCGMCAILSAKRRCDNLFLKDMVGTQWVYP
jgi:hypothetical protein